MDEDTDIDIRKAVILGAFAIGVLIILLALDNLL